MKLTIKQVRIIDTALKVLKTMLPDKFSNFNLVYKTELDLITANFVDDKLYTERENKFFSEVNKQILGPYNDYIEYDSDADILKKLENFALQYDHTELVNSNGVAESISFLKDNIQLTFYRFDADTKFELVSLIS